MADLSVRTHRGPAPFAHRATGAKKGPHYCDEFI